MARVCELTGKGRQVGNNVSHANNKTKRTFLPNLQNVTLLSEALDKSVKLRVSTHGLRSVEHVGGLDNWLAKTKAEKLSSRAVKLKRELAKKAEDRRRLSGLVRFASARASTGARAVAVWRQPWRQVQRDQQGPHPRPEIIVADDPQPRPAIGQGRGRDPFHIVERAKVERDSPRRLARPRRDPQLIVEPARRDSAHQQHQPAVGQPRRIARPIAGSGDRARRSDRARRPRAAPTTRRPARDHRLGAAVGRPVDGRAGARSSARPKVAVEQPQRMAILERHPPAASARIGEQRFAVARRLAQRAAGPVGQVVERDAQRRASRPAARIAPPPPNRSARPARRARPPAPTARRSADRARVSRHAARFPRPARPPTGTPDDRRDRAPASGSAGHSMPHRRGKDRAAPAAKLLKNLPLLNIGCKRRSGFGQRRIAS